MPRENKTITCDSCARIECSKGFAEGIPDWCATKRFQDIVDSTRKAYTNLDNLAICNAANNIVKKGYGKWPRIQEAIEFAKELKVKKVGLASCIALISELGLVAKLFSGAGLEVVCTACKIGGIIHEGMETVSSQDPQRFSCNPIAQAEICNQANTELNYILGLCLGHDILFMRYAKAPTSVLIVKDRVTGHNPAAVLYAEHPRKALVDQYYRKKIPGRQT